MVKRVMMAACVCATACLNTATAGDIAPPKKSKRFADEWDKVAFSHQLLTDALKKFVDDKGKVDYEGLRKNRKFNEYLYRLAHTDPGAFKTSEEKLAFWINAYNALTIDGVIEVRGNDDRFWADFRVTKVFPMDVPKPDQTFFRGLRFTVGGEQYTLDEIEKGVLMGTDQGSRGDLFNSVGPTKRDARVHLAIVCGSLGCPPLAREAYEPDRVEDQLAERARAFVRDESRCRFDLKNRKLEISQIFEWYADDFGNKEMAPHVGSVFEFLAKYVTDESLAKSLTEEKWRVWYIPFEWTSNDKGHLKVEPQEPVPAGGNK